MEPGRDPRLDRKEPQVEAEPISDQSSSDTSDSSGSDTSGGAAIDTALDDYLNSDEYRNDHIGNYAKIVNPDGSPATHSWDTEEQNAQEAADDEAKLAGLDSAERARLEPGLTNVDIADVFSSAKEGDPVSEALAGSLLDDVPLASLERQLQLGIANADDVHALVKDRQDQAEKDLAAALGGDKDAWIRFQHNVNGTTPTKDELANFDTAGGVDLFAADRSFGMLGIGTRPQEMLDRLNGLLGEAEKAATGDVDAALLLAKGAGLSGNALFNNDGSLNADRLGSLTAALTEMAGHPAGTDVGVPGRDTVALEPTKQDDVPLWTPTPREETGSRGEARVGSTFEPALPDTDQNHPDLGRDSGGEVGGSSSGTVDWGGDDGGDPSSGQTNDDPDAGASGDVTGGGDEAGDASSAATHDDPGLGGTGAHAGASTTGSVGDASDDSGAIEFGGSAILAGGGSATATEPGTAIRVENPDGGVTYIAPSGDVAAAKDPSGAYHPGTSGGGGTDSSASSGSSGSDSSSTSGTTVRAGPDQLDNHWKEDKSGGSSGVDDGSESDGGGGDSSSQQDDANAQEPTYVGDAAASGDDGDDTEYVDADPGGYSNLAFSSEQASAYLEQKLTRGGGDPVNPDAGEAGNVVRIPDKGTQEYITPDAASTEGGTLNRFPAPKDPVNPDMQEPLVFTGNPHDPGLASMGTGDQAMANQSSSGAGSMALGVQATGFGSDTGATGGHGGDVGESGGDQPQSSSYAATAESSGGSSAGSAAGGFAAAGSGGGIYGVATGAASGAASGGATGAGGDSGGSGAASESSKGGGDTSGGAAKPVDQPAAATAEAGASAKGDAGASGGAAKPVDQPAAATAEAGASAKGDAGASGGAAKPVDQPAAATAATGESSKVSGDTSGGAAKPVDQPAAATAEAGASAKGGDATGGGDAKGGDAVAAKAPPVDVVTGAALGTIDHSAKLDAVAKVADAPKADDSSGTGDATKVDEGERHERHHRDHDDGGKDDDGGKGEADSKVEHHHAHDALAANLDAAPDTDAGDAGGIQDAPADDASDAGGDDGSGDDAGG